MGNRTMRVAMNEEARITMTRFWEVVAFLVTSFAFLLIGLKSDLSLLIMYAPLIIAAFLVMLLARILSVYSVVGLTNLTSEKIPPVWTRILALGGLRGVVSVALALSLPNGFPFKDAIVAMTFGVALLSVILQSEVFRAFLKRQHL
jgi:CPA1 family monovalent cation:H+ antiporter